MPQPPCPYCGHTPDNADATRCDQCNGLFEPLSRKATQLAMGPWFVRDEDSPFMPGFSETILRQQVAAGRIKADTIVKGPTTHQFWMRADQAPGLSRLLGKCHQCAASVSKDATRCDACQADLSLPDEIDRLGLQFVDPRARAQAQQEIEDLRTAAPAAKPKAKPAGEAEEVDPSLMKPVTAEVDPDLMKPVAADSDDDHSGVYDTAAADASDLAEDLWQGAASAPAARRRKKRAGPDPLVLGLGVMFLCVIGLGLVILITDKNNGSGSDGDGDGNGPPKPPPVVERSAAEVAVVSVPAMSLYDRLREDGVPDEFTARFGEVVGLVEGAEQDKTDEDHTAAYDKYAQAQKLLGPLEQDVAEWRLQQEAKAEAGEVKDRVEALRAQAEAAEADKWASVSWTNGQIAFEKAAPLYDSGKYTDAISAYEEAEAMYQMSLGRAKSGRLADEARLALDAAVKAGKPEKTLRKHAEELVDQFVAKRTEAVQLFNERQYEDAEQAYTEALDLVTQANQAVEMARFSKVYAFNAGFEAAGLLLAIAAGDGVADEAKQALIGAYDKLLLADNPAGALTKDTPYPQAADGLVNTARNAIGARHGDAVKACYRAGFNARIIDQTLTTQSLTDDQRKRIHQSLGVLEAQANAAGWNVSKFASVVDAVRAANRNTKSNADPARTRSQWQRLMAPFQSRDTASRLMDPQLYPPDPDQPDPELFPGAGS